MFLLLVLACTSSPPPAAPDGAPATTTPAPDAPRPAPLGGRFNLVGVVGGSLLRLELARAGTHLTGTVTHADGKVLPLNGEVAGELWTLPFDGQVLEGRWDGIRLVGTLGAEAVVFGDGLDPVALASKVETWRRTDTQIKPELDIPVALPQIWVADPTVNTAIAALLTPEALLGGARAQLEADGWLDTVSFEAPFQKNGLVSLVVNQEGMAAYPDVVSAERVIDLKAGRVLGAESWDPARQAELISRLDGLLQAEITSTRAEFKPDEVDPELFQGHTVRAETLGRFGLRPQGVVFHYEFGFPHAMLAAEPDGDLLVPWAEVSPFLVADSPLKRAL